MTDHDLSSLTLQYIRDCTECSAVCARTAHHCLRMGGHHASPDHQGLLRDCGQLCATAVGFMSRSSRLASAVCRLCAEACAACADECERTGQGDVAMTQCATVCRACAASCERMGGAGAGSID